MNGRFGMRGLLRGWVLRWLVPPRRPDISGSNIIELAEVLRRRAGDDASFLGCPGCGGEDFAVVCRFASNGPFVSALLCVACDPPTEIGVSHGLLGGVSGWGV